MKRETKNESGPESGYMSERGKGNTAPPELATPVMKSVIVIVNTKSVVGMSGIASDPVGRRKKGTEREDTERKKMGDTSPHAVAVVDGDMTAKKVKATDDTSTKRAREAKRERTPARR